MAYAMNIGVLLDMNILLFLILRSVIPSAESFNFFCLFADTAGISAAFLLFTFHYHYERFYD